MKCAHVSAWLGSICDWNSKATIVFHYFPGHDFCFSYTGCSSFIMTLFMCLRDRRHCGNKCTSHMLTNCGPTHALITKCATKDMSHQCHNFLSTTATTSNICIHDFLMTSCKHIGLHCEDDRMLSALNGCAASTSKFGACIHAQVPMRVKGLKNQVPMYNLRSFEVSLIP